jgi:hypothetical protein
MQRFKLVGGAGVLHKYESCIICPIYLFFSYVFTSHVVIIISSLYLSIYSLLILVFVPGFLHSFGFSFAQRREKV